ncbi:GNAT family N-acetyltransferase [Methylomicrobium sp. Wu6]|uniref:GNAT family N-acetyltransferase n=1 Tax=Methylomicrobium sp. Wu6 TaxID=3107928 RepID=UPI002DD638DA|nr:GNAT family N-acetyltransferase [Methylomicrobium sp. Wu6]MEC4750558.1 GNAT family N-acetyltransferase [Methylomicrobium sp. Wu6]
MVTLDNPIASAAFDPAASTLREEHPEDETFLRRLYASTRTEEMACVPWSDEQKTAFLDMQFDLQRAHYRSYHPQGEFKIVLIGPRPAGRFYLDRSGEAFLVIDIALSPEYRGLGVGGHLLENLLAEARVASTPVRLHVEPYGRALRLYQRLGFTPIEVQGIRWLMEWKPG